MRLLFHWHETQIDDDLLGAIDAFAPELVAVTALTTEVYAAQEILAAVKALHDAGLPPARTSHILISNYEEVGHGAVLSVSALREYIKS